MKTAQDALIEENNELSTTMAQEDREMVQQIMQFFSLYPLSPADTQTVRKDLIGLALEAEKRGECLEDMIGTDLRAFCESVLENMRKDKAGYLLRRASFWLWALFAIYLADWGLYNSFPPSYGLSFRVLMLTAAVICWTLLFGRHIERKLIFIRAEKNIWTAVYMVVYFIFAWIFIGVPTAVIQTLFPGFPMQTVLFTTSGLMTAVILAALAASTQLLCRLKQNRVLG